MLAPGRRVDNRLGDQVGWVVVCGEVHLHSIIRGREEPVVAMTWRLEEELELLLVVVTGLLRAWGRKDTCCRGSLV